MLVFLDQPDRSTRLPLFSAKSDISIGTVPKLVDDGISIVGSKGVIPPQGTVVDE